jgi:hypothetical protein
VEQRVGWRQSGNRSWSARFRPRLPLGGGGCSGYGPYGPTGDLPMADMRRPILEDGAIEEEVSKILLYYFSPFIVLKWD